VERIEIIRGPGSVLWGSAAVSGIINIITKDGAKEGNKDSLSGGYGNRDKMTSGNYMHTWGDETQGKSGLISFNQWNSAGYNRPDRTKNIAMNSGVPVSEIKSNYELSWGTAGAWPALDKQRGSELYFKMSSDKNNSFVGRIIESYRTDNWTGPWTSGPPKFAMAEIRLTKAYLEYKRSIELAPSFTLNETFSADSMYQGRFPRYETTQTSLNDPNLATWGISDQHWDEFGLTAEFLGNWKVSDNNDMKMGAQEVRTRLGPNVSTGFNIGSNVDPNNHYLALPSGYDDTTALYVEDSHKFNDGKTTVFAGGRWEYDDYRQKGSIFLPRGGIIQKLSEPLSVKYIVNTGYLHPAMKFSNGLQNSVNATSPERVINNDLQLLWNQSGGAYATLTGFYARVTNVALVTNVGGVNGYASAGINTSRGVEVEQKLPLTKWLDTYGNYSYCDSHLNAKSGYTPGGANSENAALYYPRHMYNLGFDVRLPAKSNLNVHLNGWADTPTTPTQYDPSNQSFVSLKGQGYIDTAFTMKDIWSHLDLTLFANNLFNNTKRVSGNGGDYYPRGQDLGTTLTMKF
jgi:outer membrane receptor protein involved in Fe transport